MSFNHNKMFFFRGISLAFLMCFVSLFTTAQEVNSRNYSTHDGLVSNEVYHIYQDANGLLWFATDRGISVYDGYSFKNFGIAEGLTSTTVFRFFPQENGEVWCTTINNQLFYFNTTDYQFREYKYNNILAKVADGWIPNDFHRDSDGTIYLSFYDARNYVSIDGKGKVLSMLVGPKSEYKPYDSRLLTKEMKNGELFFYRNIFSPGSPPEKECDCILQGQQLNLSRVDFVQVGDHFIYYENMGHLFIKRKGKVKTLSTGMNPIGIGKFDEKHFWVGWLNDGVSIYDLEGNEVARHFEGLSISHLTHDHEDGIWVSTLTNGVFYVPDLNYLRYRFQGENVGVNKLSKMDGQHFRVDLINGDSYEYDGQMQLKDRATRKSSALSHYYEGVGLLKRSFGNNLTDIRFQDGSRPIAMGITLEGRPLIKDATATNFSDETDLPPIVIANAKLIIADENTKFETFELGSRIHDACFLGKEVLFARNDALYSFNLQTERETQVVSPELNYRVSDVDVFRGNGAVAGTRGNGLVFITPGKIWSVSKEDGLTGNFVTEVYVQNDSTIWVCTNVGLNCVTVNEKGKCSVQTITERDGLVDNDVSDVLVIDDTVWVGTRGGLSSFPLSAIHRKNKDEKYFLRLIDLTVNGAKREDLSGLGYWENRIGIRFLAISFREQLEYRYRLEGLEHSWNVSDIRELTYESLPPGEYVFVLQTGSKGVWGSEILRIPITIHPPFYTLWWFKTAILLILGLLIYLFFRYRILSYNRDITREILRQLMKRLTKRDPSFVVETDGKRIKVVSSDVYYVMAHRNYIEIVTTSGKLVVREKISSFVNLVPDPLEYLQISRSCVIRIDKVTAKSKSSVIVHGEELKVGKTFAEVMEKIHL